MHDESDDYQDRIVQSRDRPVWLGADTTDFAIDLALSWASYPATLRNPPLTRSIHHYDQNLAGTLVWVDGQSNPSNTGFAFLLPWCTLGLIVLWFVDPVKAIIEAKAFLEEERRNLYKHQSSEGGVGLQHPLFAGYLIQETCHQNQLCFGRYTCQACIL